MWLDSSFVIFLKALNYIPLFHILKDMLITAKFGKCEKLERELHKQRTT